MLAGATICDALLRAFAPWREAATPFVATATCDVLLRALAAWREVATLFVATATCCALLRDVALERGPLAAPDGAAVGARKL